jgi:hypothetical protein
MSFEKLSGALLRQRRYSNLFFDPKTLTDKEREEITKTFALSLHAEVSEIASAVNFKDHRPHSVPIDHSKLLYKSVDAFRYVLALLNLWEIDPQTFIDACEDKDLFLHRRHYESLTARGDRPVIIFDADDVIAEFRASFFLWLEKKWGVKADINDRQYYSAAEMQRCGIDSETAFDAFIAEGGFRSLPTNRTVVEAMWLARRAGYWIQILTARPASNLKCFYDTHRWLSDFGVPCDSVAFSPEKYLWVTGQEFYGKGHLVCVVDDSTKHAAEFAKHGVPVIVPAKPYNEDISGTERVTRVDLAQTTGAELFDVIRSHDPR